MNESYRLSKQSKTLSQKVRDSELRQAYVEKVICISLEKFLSSLSSPVFMGMALKTQRCRGTAVPSLSGSHCSYTGKCGCHSEEPQITVNRSQKVIPQRDITGHQITTQDNIQISCSHTADDCQKFSMALALQELTFSQDLSANHWRQLRYNAVMEC